MRGIARHAPPCLDDIVALALAEDLGGGADVTAAATVPADLHAFAAVVARAAGLAAGLDAAAAVFAAVEPDIVLTRLVAEGDRVATGTALLRMEGPARGILAAERTALNLVCHLCGVATLTARYVAEVEGTGAVVRDTRKTLPGMRALEKAAVVAGGGHNHRMSLTDGLLVKDNHIAVAGGVAAATRNALAHAGGLPVQIEVDSLDQLDEALQAGAPAVLLDNFGLNDLPAAVARCRRQPAAPEPVFVEASGGVTLDTVWAIANTGVDAVAVGAITHSAPALDLGLDFL